MKYSRKLLRSTVYETLRRFNCKEWIPKLHIKNLGMDFQVYEEATFMSAKENLVVLVLKYSFELCGKRFVLYIENYWIDFHESLLFIDADS